MVRLQDKLQDKIQDRIKDTEDCLNNSVNIDEANENQKNELKLDMLTNTTRFNNRITKDLKLWINKLPRLSTIYENDNDKNNDDKNNDDENDNIENDNIENNCNYIEI